MIEALICVLLLSFAALGYAKLNLRSMSSVSNSMWQTKAIHLALSMSDRLRANSTAWRAGRYDGVQLSSAPAAAPSCGAVSSTPCTPDQIALLDSSAWYAEASQMLPRPTLIVCKDATPLDGSPADAQCDGNGSVYAIKVFWIEHGDSQRVVLQARP